MPSIGGYTLVRELGRGAAGVVYEARHPDLPRSVALKLLGHADSESVARFEREAQSLAGVRHPNVLTIHAVGQVEQGPYLVTELLDGEDLWETLRDHPVGWERAAELTRDLARALQAVHDAGVVHRDLKPQNVVLRKNGSPVLLDFGLARSAAAETLTQSGAIVGTPAFMPPEQAQGSSAVLDARSDVYGLGAILFTLLARRAPFDGAGVMAVLDAVVTQPPRWPSADDESVPPALERICKRAMAKTPTDRYPSAAALADDLERFLRGDPVEAPPVPKGLLVALGALAIVAPLLALLWPTATPPPPLPPNPAIATRAQSTTPEPEPEARPSKPSRTRISRRAKLNEPVSILKHDAFGGGETYRPAKEDQNRVHALAVPAPTPQDAWAPRRVVTFGRSVLHLWDLDTPNSPLRSWHMPDGHPMNGFAIAADGRTVAVGSRKQVRFVDLESSSASGDQDLLEFEGTPRTLAFSPDGNWLVVGRVHDGALAYRWPDRRERVNVGSDQGWALTFSSDSRWLAAGSGKIPAEGGGRQFGFLHVWDVQESGMRKRLVNPVESPITVVAFTPDSRSLVAGDYYGGARRVEDVATPDDQSQLWELPGVPRIGDGLTHSRGRIYGLAFTLDGTLLYYLTNLYGKATLRVLRYPSGEEVRSFAPTKSSRSLALTPDGETLLLGSDHGVVEVFATR